MYLPVASGSAFNRGLVSETLFDAHKVFLMNKSQTDENEPLTQSEVNQIMSGNFYEKLSQVNKLLFVLYRIRIITLININIIYSSLLHLKYLGTTM